MTGIKLLGNWASPYSCRVIWSLKLKGIPFEYLEQDLASKSPLLLHSNPVHKKIPVLIHGGSPICESMSILEYLDETWPQQYPLMPVDPYVRAITRFWIKFVEDKSTSMWMIYRSSGKEQEEAEKATLEMLQKVEENVMGLVGDNKYFGGENIGILDIAYGVIAHWLQVVEIVGEIQLMDPRKFPKLHVWTQNFKQAPVICENLPNLEDMVVIFRSQREALLESSSHSD